MSRAGFRPSLRKIIDSFQARNLYSSRSIRRFDSITDAGTIVGRSGSDADPLRWRPFFWTPSRGMVEISARHTLAPWASATAINEAGQIAGFGSAWGPFHAGLWIPWEDLVLDFSLGFGVWSFQRGIDGNGVWTQVHPLSPQKMTVANVDVSPEAMTAGRFH